MPQDEKGNAEHPRHHGSEAGSRRAPEERELSKAAVEPGALPEMGAEDVLEALLPQISQSVFLKNRHLEFIWVNAAFAADVARDVRDLAGKTDSDLFPAATVEKKREVELRVLKTGQAEACDELLIRAGRERLVRVRRAPVFNRSGEIIGLLATLVDLNRSQRTAEELKKSEEEFRRIWEESLDGMRLTDAHGIMVRVNSAFCRMVGKPQEELEGQPFSVIYRSANQEHILAKHQERFIARSVEPLFERELALWHGRTVWFELSNSFIEVEGQPTRLLSIFRDVTERKVAEEHLQEFARRLEHSNRELQDFAYVASHDLQEPLRKVAVFGDRLKLKFGDALGAEGCDYLDRMQKAATRMQALINDLLNFSRITSKAQPFAPVDLNKIVREVAGDLEVLIEQTGARIEADSLPTIEAEPLHMRQLFQNLIGNALKFQRPGVRPIIRIEGAVSKGKGGLRRRVAEIRVSDNGIGFDEKYSERIFQVFQRLHNRAEYEGTGMGLAITRKIVEHHSGQITATSKPGEGAMFIIILPVRQLRPQQPK